MKSLLGHFLSKERTCAKKGKCLLGVGFFFSMHIRIAEKETKKRQILNENLKNAPAYIPYIYC
jgi:hypothetical protein